jgi:hypothetical protein
MQVFYYKSAEMHGDQRRKGEGKRWSERGGREGEKE